MCRSEGKGLDQGFSAEVFWWAMSRIINVSVRFCMMNAVNGLCCNIYNRLHIGNDEYNLHIIHNKIFNLAPSFLSMLA